MYGSDRFCRKLSSLRKQPSFGDATNDFPRANWQVQKTGHNCKSLVF